MRPARARPVPFWRHGFFTGAIHVAHRLRAGVVPLLGGAERHHGIVHGLGAAPVLDEFEADFKLTGGVALGILIESFMGQPFLTSFFAAAAFFVGPSFLQLQPRPHESSRDARGWPSGGGPDGNLL